MAMPGRTFNAQDSPYGFNGKRKDDEIYGSGNAYDFGARIYDPRLGRWLSVDPLFAKYSDLSPYSFVANSPLRFVDPDGKRIVDAQGRTAAYIDKSGKITFTKYATEDIKTVIGLMTATKIGNKVAENMIKAKHDITITIDKSEKPHYNSDKKLVLGETTPTFSEKDGSLVKSDIVIYESSIKLAIEKGYTKTFNTPNGEEKMSFSDKEKSEVIGANGVHEGTHATDKNSMRSYGAPKPEENPNKNEQQHYKELDEKKKTQ